MKAIIRYAWQTWTIAWLLLTVSQLAAYAQPRHAKTAASVFTTGAEDAKKMIEAYAHTMQKYGTPSGNRLYYMHMLVTTFPPTGVVLQKTAFDNRNIDVKVTTGKNRMRYESNYLAIYQDEKDVFTVVHPRRTILWSKPAPDLNKKKEDLTQNLALGQDKLIKFCTVRQCRDTTYEGKLTKIVELIPDAQAKKRYHIESLVYRYTPSEKRMRRQETTFVAGYKIGRQIITYYTIDLNYRGKLPPSARAEIFGASSGKNQLLAPFKQYQIEQP